MRAEVTDEIKQTARRHLAAHGAANLSLRAVARDVGMVSSAVYRYFASRDELLTTLILDAYAALGEAVEVAEGRVERTDLIGRYRAAWHAAREWALAQPHEYGLIYGSPVPGYAAPPDTVVQAVRPTVVLTAILADGVDADALSPPPPETLAPPMVAEMTRLAALMCPQAPLVVLARGMVAWTELFGAINFEIFGRLTNFVDDPESWFDYQVTATARFVGLLP